MKVVFLDRDGVINQERGEYTYRIEDFKLVPGLIPALKSLAIKGFKFIVITNQGGIAKGIYSHEELHVLHDYMLSLLQEGGIEIEAIYYSPYHDNYSKSLSRKPDSLMLEKAIARFKVNVGQSVMIGDSERDILAAQKVGLRGIKVDPNQNLAEILDSI